VGSENAWSFDTHALNVMPGRYRQVSVATVSSLDPGYLVDFFAEREAYRRTRFVVARLDDSHALVEIARTDDDDLFSSAVGARVLATGAECVWVEAPELDCGIASHLAEAGARHPDARCVILAGKYEHISFMLNPAPLRLDVIDVVPPTPSKLVNQVQRAIDFSEDLPPILVTASLIDSRDLLAARQPGSAEVLVPCRGGGVDLPDVEVLYLDERPELRPEAPPPGEVPADQLTTDDLTTDDLTTEDLTTEDSADGEHSSRVLLGCTRSQQIHEWFYGGPATTIVDFCPRRLLEQGLAAEGSSENGPTVPGLREPESHVHLTRCCLREEGMQIEGDTGFVPWGASLAEVAAALAELAAIQGVPWTRT